jgi:hypothetical protein
MAIQGPVPVDFGMVFPLGVYAAGEFEPVRDFDRSQGDRFVQQADKASGAPLWVVEVIDADPQARARTVKIKVASAQQPVLPPAPGGAPFVAVEFTGLTVTPYVNQAGRLAYSVKASGVRAAGTRRRIKPLDGTETDEGPRGSGPRGSSCVGGGPGLDPHRKRLSAGLFALGPHGLRARSPIFEGGQGRCFSWWAVQDLNLWPLPCQGSALPLS